MSSPNPQSDSVIHKTGDLCVEKEPGGVPVAGLVERDEKEAVVGQLRATAVGDDRQATEHARELFLSQGYYDEAVVTLRTADSATERVTAAEILGLTGSHFATPHLVAGLFDSSPAVQRAAAEALGRIGDPDVAAGPLKALIEDEEGSLMRALAALREAQLAETARARKEADDTHAAELELLRKEQSELHRAVAVAAVRRAEIQKARWSIEAEMRELAQEQEQLAHALATRRAEGERLRLEFEAEQRVNEVQLRRLETALSVAVENVERRRSELATASQQTEAEVFELDAAWERIKAAETTRRQLVEERAWLEAETWQRAEEARRLFEEISVRAQQEEQRFEEAAARRAAGENRILELQETCSRLEAEARELSAEEQRILLEAQAWTGVAEDLRNLVAEAEARLHEAAEEYHAAESARIETERKNAEQTRRESEVEMWMWEEQAAQLPEEARTHHLAENRDPESVVEGMAAQSLILSSGDTPDVPTAILAGLHSAEPARRVQAFSELARSGSKAAFRLICQCFDDHAPEVRSAAAMALCELEPLRRAESFTQAIDEGSPERAINIGEALVSSGLAAEAIEDLGSENRENTYDALCLLFAMAETAEIDPLVKAIEEHQNVEVRRAAIKLLTLSGHSDLAEAAVKRRLMLHPRSQPQLPLD